MNLVSKFALWYLAITTIVLLLGGMIVFKSVQQENDEEEVRRLTGLIEDAVARIEKMTPLDSLQTKDVTVKELNPATATVNFHTKDTMTWHSTFQGTERQIKAMASFKLKRGHYLVAARVFAPEPEETITGVIRSLSWIFFILLVLVALTSVLISKKILSPFNQTLRVIQGFNLKQNTPITMPPTRTREFAELNRFLERMTSKALHDYSTLKQFTENASHELQTPVSVIRGKLELLLESSITEEQARLIMSAHESAEKLSRINQSLTLLTKLENQEYEQFSPINISGLIHKMIFSLSELTEMKSISLETDIQENVQVVLHPALADILVMNLFSNAIRHNHENGTIKIRLSTSLLTIQNTGTPPGIPTEELFRRFTKSNQNSDSVGLGLSIVKRICEVSRFHVQYEYLDGWHMVSVRFRG
jgi:signal transduction histidine kinase